MRLFFTIILVFKLYGFAEAQTYKLHGKITNDKLEPIALVTVQLKNRPGGELTKEDGSYSFQLENGLYELIVTMVGYKPRVLKVIINNNNFEQHVILEEDPMVLSGVMVKGKAKDRAEEYVKQVIRHKDQIKSAPGAFSSQLYIKAVQIDSLTKRRKMAQASGKDSLKTENADLEEMAMAEIYLRLHYQSPTRYKEERLGITKRGNVNGLFHLSTTDGMFNIYDNLIKLPAVSATPFLSPVSYSGLLAYKYKTIKTEQKDNHHIYTIEVKPVNLSNATIEGEMVIDDSAWVVLQTKFTLPRYHLPEYDFFEVAQTFDFISNTAWMPVKQKFIYYSKSNRGKVSGETTVGYSNYELNKFFEKKYFGPEVSTATDSAYARDSQFWYNVRTVPLTEKEIRFINYKDSIYTYTHTKAYLDSIDRKLNKVTWQNILYKSQPLSNHERGTKYTFPSLVSVVGPYLFSFGGLRLGLPFYFIKTNPKDRKAMTLNSEISYGFLNRDVNGRINFWRKYNAVSQAYYTLSAVRNFAAIYQGDAWINMVKRNNYYLDNSLGVGWGREIFNGLNVNMKIDMALRRSLEGYKTYNFIDSFFTNNLGEKDNKAPAFDAYNALYSSLELRYTPFQPYIREPFEKINLNSKWPTLYAQWRKGVSSVLGSKVNFDYLELGLQQNVKLGLVGISNYTIKTGSFLNRKDLRYVDYKFQRRGDPYLFMNPHQAFQALDSTFPVFKRFYEGHYFHEFNGVLFNKIPLFKKVGLREVGGAGFLFAPERNLKYAEAYIGVERVFKSPFQFLQKFKLGVYMVGSVANQFSNPVQFKFGITTWDTWGNKWR